MCNVALTWGGGGNIIGMCMQNGGACGEGGSKTHGDSTHLHLNLKIRHDFRSSLGVGKILAFRHLDAGDLTVFHDDALYRDADVVVDDGNSDDKYIGVRREVRDLAHLEAFRTICKCHASLCIVRANSSVPRAGLDCSTHASSERLVEVCKLRVGVHDDIPLKTVVGGGGGGQEEHGETAGKESVVERQVWGAGWRRGRDREGGGAQ